MLWGEYNDAVAAFIRTRSITRCPTAWELPTQAIIAATDRAALEGHAAKTRETARTENGCLEAILSDLSGSGIDR